MKVLISWHAYMHDVADGSINIDGPTASFHAHYYKHDKHLLLSPEKDDDIRALHIHTYLKKNYPERDIEIIYMDIQDPINHAEIQSKIHPLLAEYKDDQIDVFVSPGTPAMQVVWYLAHQSLNLNTTLYQTRPKQYTAKKDKPELIKIQMERSAIGVTALYHQKEISKPTSQTDYFITPTMEKIYENARKVALTDEVTVLILGASGTGKENLAKFIHKNSIGLKQTLALVIPYFHGIWAIKIRINPLVLFFKTMFKSRQ